MSSPSENLIKETYFQIPSLFHHTVINNVLSRAEGAGHLTLDQKNALKTEWTNLLQLSNTEPPLVHENELFFPEPSLKTEQNSEQQWQEEQIGDKTDAEIAVLDFENLFDDLKRPKTVQFYYSNFKTENIIEASTHTTKENKISTIQNVIATLKSKSYVFSSIKVSNDVVDVKQEAEQDPNTNKIIAASRHFDSLTNLADIKDQVK